MKIKRFSRLRNCGIFRDFTWPASLPDFGRFNLIYGWNWTGKTTLSRVLRDLELRRTPSGEEVIVQVDGGDVIRTEFPQQTIQVRVFNRDFVDEVVFSVKNTDLLPPIYVLGKDSVEMQKKVDGLKAERAKKEEELSLARTGKEQSKRALDKHCVDRARAIKEALRSSGQHRFNNYDKAAYQAEAEKLATNGNPAIYRLTDIERDKLLAQHRATRKSKVGELTYRIPSLEHLADSVSDTLKTSGFRAAIEALKDDPVLAEWMLQGLNLHQQRQVRECLFCGQPLPTNRLALLEAHFSEAYRKFVERLEQQLAQLMSAQEEIREFRLQLPKRAELYDDMADEYDSAEDSLRQVLDRVEPFLEALIRRLNEKRIRLFDRLSLEVNVPTVDPKVVDVLNAVIRKHNQACDDFGRRVNEARDRLAFHMIAERLDEFIQLKDAVEIADKRVKDAQIEAERLTKEIEQLEREIVEHRLPAEELNEDLKKYLGHNELQLKVKETGYTITRNGVPADRLSEGETTAIALLYFLKSLGHKDFDLKTGVVVLDDPVSSLDANALYLALGFIRSRTENAGQLFVFTHNFSFFREVRYWFNHLPKEWPVQFYMLECTREGGQRAAAIRRLDPLLKDYESEYHYLFACIYRATMTRHSNLQENYALPNMARRLLESFLAFRHPKKYRSGDLWRKMETMKYDEAKKLRIIRFLNTYSHSDAIQEPEHDPCVLAEADSVLKDLLEFIRAQDPVHHDEMVDLVKQSASQGGSRPS